MTALVDFLVEGRHPLTLARYSGAAELKERIDRGYLLLKFTDTRGGTELGLRLDKSRCDLVSADFEHSSGTAHVSGHLTLDYVDIEVWAEIDLATLTGSGTVRRAPATMLVETN